MQGTGFDEPFGEIADLSPALEISEDYRLILVRSRLLDVAIFTDTNLVLFELPAAKSSLKTRKSRRVTFSF
jgi:hypothetical protein